MDEIIIRTLCGIEPGVRQSLHGDDIKDRNVIRKDAIPAKKQIEVKVIFDIYMKEELACMYTRISTSASEYLNRGF